MTRQMREILALTGAGAALMGALALSDIFRAPFSAVAHADPSAIKFTGAGSCETSQCHGSGKSAPQFKGDIQHNESTIWGKLDKHAVAFKSKNLKVGLLSEQSKKIAAKLGLENAATSERCLMCHALSGLSNAESKSRVVLNVERDVVAADVASKKFNLAHGVSCDGCHGPAEKYLAPHVEKGWTAKQRAALGSEKLFVQFGLFDTKNLKMRANMCVSCHLKIDPELINADHPELPFELDTFCHGDWMHWPAQGNFTGVQAWALGQAVSMREAALQLAQRVRGGEKVNPGLKTDSYKQLVAHVLMARHAAILCAPELDDQIAKQLGAVNDNWADAAKLEAALAALGQSADALADKLNLLKVDQAWAETLVKNVAAEGEAAGSKGYRAAQQYVYAMGALWESNFLKGDAPLPDRRAMDAKTKDDPRTQAITDVSEALLDPPNYKADVFNKAVRKLMALIPGGVALALPPNAPDLPKVLAVAPPPAPPVAVVPPVPVQGVKAKPEFIFCPECGRKWPYEYRYCPDDGHALPRFEE